MRQGDTSSRATSTMWLVAGGLCAMLALGFAIAAIVIQRTASSPIGEGQVFLADAAVAQSILEESSEAERAVRRARNLLEVEAVSIIGPAGVSVSTSETLIGHVPTNPLLSFASDSGRFVALAAAVEHPVLIDGVEEWPAGSVLYQVLKPLDDGRSLLIYYDVSSLLARRSRPIGIQPETIQLLALAGIFGVLGVVVMVGHIRATRHRRQIEAESKALRAANEDLAKARNEAERALALAEEKIRIRSDFVLMINHELRTPLTSLVTGAKLLQEGDLTAPERNNVVRSMITDGDRLEEIIDQILAVATIENRGLSYVLENVPVSRVHHALADLEIDVETAPGTDRTAVVHTDLRTLMLVVTSLADNARTHGASRVTVRYGTESIALPMVEVGRRPENALFIAVVDNGPGIPLDFLPRAFEKFEKSSFNSGTGLGLYMARLMIEALEGSIAIDTRDSGTIVQLAIPLVTSPAMAEAT